MEIRAQPLGASSRTSTVFETESPPVVFTNLVDQLISRASCVPLHHPGGHTGLMDAPVFQSGLSGGSGDPNSG